jgi:hypothetical protein
MKKMEMRLLLKQLRKKKKQIKQQAKKSTKNIPSFLEQQAILHDMCLLVRVNHRYHSKKKASE